MPHRLTQGDTTCFSRSRTIISRSAGFTLIELLVVVSIVSLLISLLLPALSAARAAGQAVQCLSNLRQIGVGFTMYHNDWDEWIYPQGYQYEVWQGAIDRYLGGEGYTHHPRATTLLLFRCPANNFNAQAPTISGEMTGLPGNRFTSGITTARRLGEIRRPAQNVLVVETRRDGVGRSHVGWGAWAYRGARFRGHSGNRSNVLFLDMHAEVTPEEHPLIVDGAWWSP